MYSTRNKKLNFNPYLLSTLKIFMITRYFNEVVQQNVYLRKKAICIQVDL
jgi:hypothetical protein